MDSNRFDRLGKDLATATDRRRVVRGAAVAGLAGLAALALVGGASARDEPRNDLVDKRCLNRCQRRSNGHRDCHERCRRNRKNGN